MNCSRTAPGKLPTALRTRQHGPRGGAGLQPAGPVHGTWGRLACSPVLPHWQFLEKGATPPLLLLVAWKERCPGPPLSSLQILCQGRGSFREPRPPEPLLKRCRPFLVIPGQASTPDRSPGDPGCGSRALSCDPGKQVFPETDAARAPEQPAAESRGWYRPSRLSPDDHRGGQTPRIQPIPATPGACGLVAPTGRLNTYVATVTVANGNRGDEGPGELSLTTLRLGAQGLKPKQSQWGPARERLRV